MQSLEHLKVLYLVHLSQPRADRTVYQAIRAGNPQTILELGMGSGLRAQRMIALATSQADGKRISYTGADPFEASKQSQLSLKAAYQQLLPTGAKLRLIPGEPMATLPQVANGLGQFDLVVISADTLSAQTPRGWYYLQRLLHPESVVLVEESAVFRPFALSEVESRGLTTRTRRAA